ncbi:MAG: hypothetical protein IPN61_06120 [Bacteroidetes bacterium]|nr:hypothetical protein [Bacteroidota bacterium]
MTKIGKGSLEIPAQTATGSGAGVLPCQVVDHTFTSTSSQESCISVLMYNDNNICAGQTVLITTNWTKQ